MSEHVTPEEEDQDPEIQIGVEDVVPTNIGTARGAAKMSKEQRALVRRDQHVLQLILSTPDGRAWMADLLFRRCGLMLNPENAAHDTNTVHYTNGMQAVGRGLHEDLKILAPAQYVVLITENLHKT